MGGSDQCLRMQARCLCFCTVFPALLSALFSAVILPKFQVILSNAKTHHYLGDIHLAIVIHAKHKAVPFQASPHITSASAGPEVCCSQLTALLQRDHLEAPGYTEGAHRWKLCKRGDSAQDPRGPVGKVGVQGMG